MKGKQVSDFRSLKVLFEGGQKFCAFDTETSGLVPKKDRIIELGAVLFDKTGDLATFSQFIKINFSLSNFITKITGITDSDLSKGMPCKNVLEDFLQFANGAILIAHNAKFDENFLNAELERAGMSPLKNYTLDTLKLSRWAYPLEKSHKLQDLATRLKIKTARAHRAYDDAILCKKIFFRILRDTENIQIA